MLFKVFLIAIYYIYNIYMYTPYPLKNPKNPRVFALSGCANLRGICMPFSPLFTRVFAVFYRAILIV